MPTISMSDFVSFISASTPTRIAIARDIKSRDNQPYDIKKDYYKRLREATISLEKGNLALADYENLPTSQKDPKKKTGFKTPVEAYLNWRKENNLSHAAVTRGQWEYQNLVVRLNPELSVFLNGKKHHIKLNFKTEPISLSRSDLILQLMTEGLCTGPEKASILNVREKVIRTLNQSVPDLSILLRVEAAAFCAAWDIL